MGGRLASAPRYAKGADPIAWGAVVIAPLAAVSLTLTTAGVAVLPYVLLALAIGLVYGAAAFYLLRPNAAGAVLAIGFFVSLAVLTSTGSRLVGALPTWLMSGLAGSIIGAHFRYLVDRRHKQAQQPARGTHLETRWRTGRRELVDAKATAGTLERKVEALDGAKTTIVSALRGCARMDFCGDARGAMVVFYNPDTADEDHWSLLVSPGTMGPSLEVVIGDLKGTYERQETTSLESALLAARRFAAAGNADSSLSWKTSPEIFERRPLAY